MLILASILASVKQLDRYNRTTYNVSITLDAHSIMKLQLKKLALNLRKKGFSIPDISNKLGVSKSTTSLWCKTISLTKKQEQLLSTRTHRKLANFFKMVAEQKAVRDKKKQGIIDSSSKKIGLLSKRDILIAGVALYWAEGFKHEAESRVGFCNSDPRMMKFMILFLKKSFGVEEKDLSPRLTLNEAFRDRVSAIQKFWSDYLGISESQFSKPFYQKVKQVKVYQNAGNYHGVLRIHVKKSSVLLTEMRGYLRGLSKAGPEQPGL